MNICVKHGLKALTNVESASLTATGAEDTVFQDTSRSGAADEDDHELDEIDCDEAASTNAALQAAPEYATALRNDPVKLARQLVTACRASGGRRAELREVIKEGNRIHAFGDKPLPELQLLRDVDTRWSSTFLMINRVLTLHPVWRLS